MTYLVPYLKPGELGLSLFVTVWKAQCSLHWTADKLWLWTCRLKVDQYAVVGTSRPKIDQYAVVGTSSPKVDQHAVVGTNGPKMY